MPKRPNVHRLASKAIHLADALESALEGKYEIGLIEAPLGFSSFRIALVGGRGTRTVAITSAVLRGGRASAGYAQRGHYLIVDGTEVRGVVNTQRDFKRLIKAGRIPATNTNDEFFDMEASESDSEVDIWANQKAKAAQIAQESQALASELEARIRRRRAGHVLPNASAPVLSADDSSSEEDDEAAEAEVAELAELDDATPVRKQITSTRRLRKMALAAAAEEAARNAVFSAKDAERAALAARYAAEEEAERAAEEAALALARRAVPVSWEDEIDIDSL